MSTVTCPATSSPPAPPATGPPVRHGTARLLVEISGEVYTVRRVKAPIRGARCLALKKLSGEHRIGRIYGITRLSGIVSCTCPDHRIHGASCKHMNALAAVGLLPRHFVPAAASFGQGLAEVDHA